MSQLLLSQIDALRAKSEPLSTQIAGYVSSDQFKSAASDAKPPAPSMRHHFSDESRDFAGSALKKTANRPVTSRSIPLGTGRPGAELYPWDAIAIRAESPAPVQQATQVDNTATDTRDLGLAHNTIERLGGSFNLARGLNYGHAAGSQPLVRFMTEHVELVHNPPYRDWSTCLSGGATSAMEMALRIFCNRGDAILTEAYTYPGTVEGAQLLHLRLVGIDMDAGGLIPAHLRHTLSTWRQDQQGPRPTVLYTIPSGQNPTGATLSLDRKKAIYEVADEFDLIIIEDDPYYFLQLDLAAESAVDGSINGAASQLESAKTFLATLKPSFLNLDTNGRVVRLDSTSKILAPGLRTGWVTASKEIVDKFISYAEVSTVAVSGPSQLMLWHLLEATWGHVGFFSWLTYLSQQYRHRLDLLMAACSKHLPRELCSWAPPQNGMFIWLVIDVTKHPSFHAPASNGVHAINNGVTNGTSSTFCAKEIENRIFANGIQNGVQVTKGSLFGVQKHTDHVLHIRLTSAAAEESEFDLGVRKFAEVLREEFGI